MAQIKAQIEDTTSDYDREKLQERLAKLAGGVAVIKVGAATEVELKEKKHRIEDALSTTRAAVEEGLVAGGGTTLLQAIPALDKIKLEGDEQVGVDIVRKALEAPARQIADNAGQSGEVVVNAVRGLPIGHGYDALKGEYGDMFEKGIVDAAKVTRSALQNAASIAAMVLTTETLITDLPEKAARPAPAAATSTAGGWTSSPSLAQPATTTAPGGIASGGPFRVPPLVVRRGWLPAARDRVRSVADSPAAASGRPACAARRLASTGSRTKRPSAHRHGCQWTPTGTCVVEDRGRRLGPSRSARGRASLARSSWERSRRPRASTDGWVLLIDDPRARSCLPPGGWPDGLPPVVSTHRPARSPRWHPPGRRVVGPR